jgi:hypothetical protein
MNTDKVVRRKTRRWYLTEKEVDILGEWGRLLHQAVLKKRGNCMVWLSWKEEGCASSLLLVSPSSSRIVHELKGVRLW